MQKNNERKFGTAITPAAALAFSLGTSIGWGSLVVTANTYLSQSGPMGSVIGLVIGALIMLVISRNYHYMINCFPDAGGSYAFARDAFGFDYGFLTAWFLMLTYLAMLWANATAIPLFARNFFGEIFHFGYMYTVFAWNRRVCTESFLSWPGAADGCAGSSICRRDHSLFRRFRDPDGPLL